MLEKRGRWLLLIRKEAGGCWLQERGRWMLEKRARWMLLAREQRQVDVFG